MEAINETSLYKILRILANYSNMFSFVIREDVELNDEMISVIDRLSNFLIKKEIVDEWPGTKLLIDKAVLYKFHLTNQAIDLLIDIESNLYNWVSPNLPEDIVMYNDNIPIFISITHEKFAYLKNLNKSIETNILQELK